jgi:hypothetical protein
VELIALHSHSKGMLHLYQQRGGHSSNKIPVKTEVIEYHSDHWQFEFLHISHLTMKITSSVLSSSKVITPVLDA